MNILVTGSKGFIGKNLIQELKNRYNHEIYEYDIDTKVDLLDCFCKNCDFVFHLAGINRPQDNNEFMKGNFGFTSELLDKLKFYSNNCPIVVSSSIQAILDNPYGLSKRASENLLFDYSSETGAEVIIYRFPNVYGKWGKPNYNSVVATLCHNISHNLPVSINNRDSIIKLVYIDDVFNELINAMEHKGNKVGFFYKVPIETETTLGNIVDLIYSFRYSRKEKRLPNMGNYFEKTLYSTYLSYIAPDDCSFVLDMKKDERGSFTEVFRTDERGQFSVNILHSKVEKGNHWHHSKNEKFLVVNGECLIRIRQIDSNDIFEYQCSGEKLEIVDIPCGYTHSITNIGSDNATVVMWSNECFNPNSPDTFPLKVD